MLPEKIAGHRVGWSEDTGLLWAEGHPADLVGGSDLLCPPGLLREALGNLWLEFCADGIEMPAGRYLGESVRVREALKARPEGFGGVGRCDSTVDLRFGSPSEGVAVLSGVLAVFRAMRGQAATRFEKGSLGRGVETAYLFGHGGKRALGRWYDKGIQTGEQVRGVWVRGEDQRRWSSPASRRDVDELTADYVRGHWQRRFLPLYKASKGVTVAGPVVLLRKLRQAVDAGEISERRAQGVALAMCEDLGGVALGSRSARYRWRSQAQILGLVLGDGVLEDVEVDLHAVLEAALDTNVWMARG